MNIFKRTLSPAGKLCLLIPMIFLLGSYFSVQGQETPTPEIPPPTTSADCYSRIAFMYGLLPHDVYVVDGDGSQLTQLTEDGHDTLGIEWAPDGTQIAF